MPSFSSSSNSLKFSKITANLNVNDNRVSGTLHLTAQALVFTMEESDTRFSHQIQADDVKEAVWFRRASDYSLSILTPPFDWEEIPFSEEQEKSQRSNLFARQYSGFRKDDFSSVADFFQRSYSIKINKLDRSLSGTSAGECDLEWAYNVMRFMAGNKLGFQIPLSEVNACDLSSKNETVIKFKAANNPVSLVEMRFFVPSTGTVDDDETKIEAFREKITRLAFNTEIEAICEIPDVNLIIPRGRYDIKFNKAYIDLKQNIHGKSFDYKVPYGQIIRVFLLPHLEKRLTYFALNVNPPIRQGQTLYHFLIIQCNTDEEMELEVNLPADSNQAADSRTLKGDTCEVLGEIFRKMFGKKITVPGSFKTKSSGSAPCIHCSFRASNGLLFPLDKGLFFMHKPTIYIKYSDIVLIDLGSLKDIADPQATASNLKTCTMDVQVKDGGTYSFSSIDRDEQNNLGNYLREQGVEIGILEGGKAVDVDKDEFKRNDPYLNRITLEARLSELGLGNEEEDDDDEDDEDFVGKSPEGDSEAETESD